MGWTANEKSTSACFQRGVLIVNMAKPRSDYLYISKAVFARNAGSLQRCLFQNSTTKITLQKIQILIKSALLLKFRQILIQIFRSYYTGEYCLHGQRPNIQNKYVCYHKMNCEFSCYLVGDSE